MANLHALALLAQIIATAILLRFGPRRRPSIPSMVIAAIFVALIAWLLAPGFGHACKSGDPVMQCTIGGICLWAVFAFAGNLKIQAGGSALVLVSTFLLCNHYNDLVHSVRWIGNEEAIEHSSIVRSKQFAEIQAEVRESGLQDNSAYGAGWFRDSEFSKQINSYTNSKEFRRFELERTWHSWFTRLIRVVRTRQDIWYPGGKLTEAADHLELRDIDDIRAAR